MSTIRPRKISLPHIHQEDDDTAIDTQWSRVGVLDEPEPQHERAILATPQLVAILKAIEDEIGDSGECRIVMFSPRHGKPGRILIVDPDQLDQLSLAKAKRQLSILVLHTPDEVIDWCRYGYRGRPVLKNWSRIKDGHKEAFLLFRRHYSAVNRTPKIRQFVGPGEKVVLLGKDGKALFVWRKEKYRQDGQRGINCSIFRNEGNTRSSELIREAMELAWERWPGERLFTFVDPGQIRSSNPGCCFLKANWHRCGKSKRGLLILEAMPPRIAVANCG